MVLRANLANPRISLAEIPTYTLPDQFSSLISPDTDLSSSIESLDPGSFDPQNQYAAALDAVRDASGDKSAELKIFRVEITSTKIEYWILAFAKPEGRLVGLRAKAVES